jgi:hypothetical protein
MVKINKSQKKSIFKQVLENKKSSLDLDKDNFKVSLEHFDSSQRYGSSFKDWQKKYLLAQTLNTLSGYCRSPLLDQVDGDKFTIYGDFPKKNLTKFFHPDHVSMDANWARIHITGKIVIIGHVIENMFYLVFLDTTHSFWLTKRDRGAK